MARCFSRYRLASVFNTRAASCGSFALYFTLIRFVSLMGCTVRSFSNLTTARAVCSSSLCPIRFKREWSPVPCRPQARTGDHSLLNLMGHKDDEQTARAVVKLEKD